MKLSTVYQSFETKNIFIIDTVMLMSASTVMFEYCKEGVQGDGCKYFLVFDKLLLHEICMHSFISGLLALLSNGFMKMQSKL